MKNVLAIDAGNTNYLKAIVRKNGKIEYVEDSDTGELRTPAAILFSTKDGADWIKIGSYSKEQAVLSPKNFVSNFKRKVGSKELVYKNEGKGYTAGELTSMMLKKMKQDAEEYLGESVEAAVITVPEEFNHHERNNVKLSASIAGFKEVYLRSETEAAAKACSEKYDLNGKDVISIDVGGSTTDIAGFKVSDKTINVLFTMGDKAFAGQEFDEVMSRLIKEKTAKEATVKMDELNAFARQELVLRSERAKEELSKTQTVNVLWQYSDEENAVATVEIRREEFEEACKKELVPHLKKLLEDVKEAAKGKKMNVETVVVTGGTANIPLVQTMVKESFPGVELYIKDPETMICRGAALFARELIADPEAESLMTSKKLIPVCNRAYGIRAYVRSKEDPDEEREMVSNVIWRNEQLPATVEKTYYTRFDNQTSVHICVYEADKTEEILEIEEATKIAEARLNIEGDLPKSSPILVSMKLDMEHILHVKAEDLTGHTYIETTVKVTPPLNEDEEKESRQKMEDLFDRAAG